MVYIYFFISFFTFLFIALIFKAYIKIKYPFWQMQPVFHYYNFSYWVIPPGIICQEMPSINKYNNLINIETLDIDTINKDIIDDICKFIKSYYVQLSNTEYNPTKSNIISYLSGCNHKSYISIYQNYSILKDINNKEILSIISARSLNVTLRGVNTFPTYYIDNLCVHSGYRKKGFAPQMIQTHSYNLRKLNSKIKTCLFKREGQLTTIVPLTTFETFCFEIVTNPVTNILNSSISIIEIGVSQLSLFMDFVIEQRSKYSCIILPDLSNIMELIKTQNICIYGIIEGRKLIAVYIFRKPGLFYSKQQAIECFFTSYTCKDNSIFINGFYLILCKIIEKWSSRILLIENTSDAHLLIDDMKKLNINCMFKSPTAFFLYNYACHSIKSSNTLIMY